MIKTLLANLELQSKKEFSFLKKKERGKIEKIHIFEGEVPKYRPVLETHIEVPAGTSNPS